MRAAKALLECTHYALMLPDPEDTVKIIIPNPTPRVTLGETLTCHVCPAVVGMHPQRSIVEITEAKNVLQTELPG